MENDLKKYRVEMRTECGGYGWMFDTAKEVYNDLIESFVQEEEASKVEKWCENGSIGDVYTGENYNVYIMSKD